MVHHHIIVHVVCHGQEQTVKYVNSFNQFKIQILFKNIN